MKEHFEISFVNGIDGNYPVYVNGEYYRYGYVYPDDIAKGYVNLSVICYPDEKKKYNFIATVSDKFFNFDGDFSLLIESDLVFIVVIDGQKYLRCKIIEEKSFWELLEI
jgi:hypothetical protein